MGTNRSPEFDDLVWDAEHQSDKALYKHLHLHIFGPYQGDSFAYLTEMKLQLREFGFENARICDDRNDSPPANATDEELWEFWWKQSEDFLQNADVGIFVFLDYLLDRPNLPERAREQARESKEEPVEMNSSVIGELFYWVREEDFHNERTLLLFEEEIYEEFGSVITGLVHAEGLDFEVINNEDIKAATMEARQRSMNWAMGELRETLRARRGP